MGLLDALELEERVGHAWHRLVGERASWPRHPDAAIGLDEIRGQLAVFFRGLGGDFGLQIAAAASRTSGHRLSWRQRLGMDGERMVAASRDEVSLTLPGTIAYFPDRGANRDLYFWLAAFLAVLEPPALPPSDALQADLQILARAGRATAAVLTRFPGLSGRHARLAQALLLARPRRRLSGIESRVEALVVAMLGGPACPDDLVGLAAPAGYRPFLPVPLWGEALVASPGSGPRSDPDPDGADTAPGADAEDKRRHAERRDQNDSRDPLILNRFEKILAMAEMVNVNRGIDDPDEAEARRAADELDAITLSRHSRRSATKLKFDLDLPPEATDATRLSGTWLYPEWDWRARAYHPDHCSVTVTTAGEDGEGWCPDDEARRRIHSVRRQFEALRTRAVTLRAQADGGELDTDAVVRARTDLIASGIGSERVWTQRRPLERDLAVTVLVDCSLSTDAWIDNRRVLDVEKEALAVLCHGLAACGDSFSVLGFSSRRRSFVRVDTIKGFDEPFGDTVMRRIGAIRPGYYTRIGAALRHATARLEERPNRHRLLLVVTDGKPNDVDHYEGRYGIEDTRKAVLEARAKGVSVFGVTVDSKAQSYFPHLFGRGSFAIVAHLAHLSAALPRIYRHLVAA